MIDSQLKTFETMLSLVNPIDQLAVLDRQVKDITATCKTLKDNIANTYGEGKFRGEKYGVRVTIENRKGTLDMAALCAAYGIAESDLEKFRGDSVAVIKVSTTV
jgi:hypothetical protein